MRKILMVRQSDGSVLIEDYVTHRPLGAGQRYDAVDIPAIVHGMREKLGDFVLIFKDANNWEDLDRGANLAREVGRRIGDYLLYIERP